MDLKNRLFYVSPIQRKQVCWWNGSLSSVLANDTRCTVSCHSWTSLYAFLLSIILTLTDPLDPAKTHWLITFHHLFSIKPCRVQIKFEKNRNYAELKLPSFQLTWSKHWSTWFSGHRGIQWLIKAPPSTLPLIDSESEYSCCSDRFKKKKSQHSEDTVLHRTTECERRRRIFVQPGHSDILKTLRKNLQREASCCFSPFSAAAAENAAALNLSSGCQIFLFFFLPPRVHWWIFQQVVNKPGWLLESRRLQLTHQCFCSFASRHGATREPF